VVLYSRALVFTPLITGAPAIRKRQKRIALPAHVTHAKKGANIDEGIP